MSTSGPSTNTNLTRLLEIMRRLRAADGCPWDRVQTYATIAPYTIEEAYEVADAIERGDFDDLRDELGDLLFQVVFHARMAEEEGRFDFDSVAGAICDKLLRRHPHVFEGEFPEAGESSVEGESKADAAAVLEAWETMKEGERRAKHAALATGVPGGEVKIGALAGVTRSLPALVRADKLSKRAARVGFDFEEATQTADKVAEELAEVREAVAHAAGTPSEHVTEEIGDLLFAAANLARKVGVDPETALRAANLKFERRFEAMERLAGLRGLNFAELDLAAQEALWKEVKRDE